MYVVCMYECRVFDECAARTTDRVRVASRNRYRPVECLGEDWTGNRHGGSRTTGARVFLPLPYPLSLCRCFSALRVPSVRPRCFLSSLLVRFLSCSLSLSPVVSA